MDWGNYTLQLGFSQTTNRWNRISQTRTATVHGAFTQHTEEGANTLTSKITELINSLLAIKMGESAEYSLSRVDNTFYSCKFQC